MLVRMIKAKLSKILIPIPVVKNPKEFLTIIIITIWGGTYYVLGTGLSTLPEFLQLILPSRKSTQYFYSHFIDEKIEAWGDFFFFFRLSWNNQLFKQQSQISLGLTESKAHSSNQCSLAASRPVVNGLPITKPSTQQTSETQLPVLPGCLLYYQKTISRGLISYFQSLCHEAFIFYWTIYRFVLKCPTPLMCINSNFSSAYE